MKAISRKILCLIAALMLMTAFSAVSVSAASLKISKSSVSLPVGYSIKVSVTGANSNITWSSGDSSIAEVTALDGSTAKIVGKGTGTAYVYASVGKQKLKCKVTVREALISSNASSVEMTQDQAATFTLTVKGSKDIAAVSSDNSVCSISWGKWDGDTIKLTASAKNSGTAVISVYAKGDGIKTAKKLTIKIKGMEEQVIDIVNKERKDAGASGLKQDDKLMEAAAVRAREIAEYFDHTRPDGTSCFTVLKGTGVSYRTAGENIAGGQRNAQEVMDSWMTSPGHKGNILSRDFKKIGVGCYKSGNTYYWVQLFTG